MNGNKRNRFKVVLVIILIIGLFSTVAYFSGKNHVEDEKPYTYDQVVTQIKKGEVTRAEAYTGDSSVKITLEDGSEKTVIVPSIDLFSELVSAEIENGSEIEFEMFEAKSGGFLSSIFSSLFTIFLYIILFSFLMRRMTANIGGDNTEFKPVTSKTTFKDVAGIDEEREQLQEVVDFLKNPRKFIAMGAKIPKGVLMEGDPGTGKTLLARAIAGEAGVPFFQVTGSSFEEKFVGVGASRVRTLFNAARKVAPCIIFIDEIDSVAKSRYSGNNYSEQTLNQLLAEMDGFTERDNIIVIAATNHIQVLDEAIKRPGRFDRHVHVPRPDVIGREKILKIHARNKYLAADVDFKNIAKKTVGFTGADLENVMNEAAIYAVKQNKRFISAADIDEAIARVLVGLEKKNAAITDADKKLTAVHEAGHAIVSALVRPEVKNFGISIVPRGSAGGYNFFDESDKTYSRKSDMLKQLKVLYGGRIAEEVVLNDISSGASNDLEKASNIAYLMVTRYAMNGSLLVKIGSERDYNEQLDRKTMPEEDKICREAYEETKKLVEENKEVLEMLADILYEKEYLSQEEVEAFMQEKLRKAS